jgi:hypothetical protein
MERGAGAGAAAVDGRSGCPPLQGRSLELRGARLKQRQLGMMSAPGLDDYSWLWWCIRIMIAFRETEALHIFISITYNHSLTSIVSP